ncbi:hypothetical protein Ddye_032134 [Dipteronia dyeriana]|uniref:SWIM-type domain-containing protein n=1 Tax=Dipteronia dyeriana TaxID=168575 RepID=A0AAD9TJP3_9ROSI|nr:hypothetical protein Ddye_032134 [Dipteronia dyeriana]
MRGQHGIHLSYNKAYRSKEHALNQFYDRRTNAHEMSTYLTTFADEHIKDKTDTTQRCEIHPIHFNKFKVDDKWKEITVDFNEHSCSCHEWDLDDLSCSHAIAVARYASQSFNYVHLSVVVDFTNLNFCLLDISNTIQNRIVLPWQNKNIPGRPKKLRIPSAGEKRKLHSCSKCGKKGHKKTTCPEPSSSTNKLAKKAQPYSICKKEGHNRLKCPDKPHKPILINMDKENSNRPTVI